MTTRVEINRWPKRPLIDVAKLQRGFDLPVQNRLEGDVPVFAANGPIGTHSEAICKGPGVVTGRSGTIGKVHFIDSDYWPLNTSLFVVDFCGNYPKWVYYMLEAFRLDRFAQGAGVPTLNRNLVHGELVSVPPIAEQKRIVAILDKADSLRRKRREAIRLTDNFLRATFIDMFGDPVSNPKGWVTSSIIDLCSLGTGGTPSRDESSFFDGPHPWIKTGEVDSDWITTSEEHISDKAISESNCKLFPPKTILVAMYGQGKTRGKVGMLGIAAATNQACAAILPSDKINSDFLLAQLRLMYDYLRAMGRGGNQENLNLGMIKNLKVLVPPPELVTKYVDILQRATKVKSKAVASQNTIDCLAMSFNSKFFA